MDLREFGNHDLLPLMPESTFFSASQYESICHSLPDPVFILTESGRYTAILGGKDKRYYHDGSSLIGKFIADVLSPAKAQWFLQQIQHALKSQQMLVVEYELSVHDVLGVPAEGPVEPIWFEGRISALQEFYDGEAAVLWVASNITNSKIMRQQLQQQALSDELTGLHNRRFFMQTLERAYRDFVDCGRSACLVSFDVDNFKAINDGLGHPAGDQALRDLASAVQGLASAEDVVCRLGGDEFAILCQRPSAAQTLMFAQHLLHGGHAALQPYVTQGCALGISVGMAHFTAMDCSVEDIMRRADQALYVAKAQGGQQLSYPDDCLA